MRTLIRFSVGLVFILSLSLVGSSQGQVNDTLKVGDANGQPGDLDVSVFVSLANITFDVGGFTFTLKFDTTALTFDPAEVADPSLVVLRTLRTATFEVFGANIDLNAGTVTVLATADLLPPIDPCLPVGSGPIVEILFDVKGDAAGGDYPLDVTSGAISNCAGTEEITPILTDGTFTVCADGMPCDDGDPCTENDVFINCVCQGTPKDCDDGNPCTEDYCDPVTGDCVHDPVPDGTPCDDGDPCTENDVCINGVCQGTPVCDCTAPDLVQPTDFSGHIGDTVYTDITIYQNQNAIDAFGLQLTFDNSVLAFDRVEACDLTANWITVSGSEIGPGLINIGGFDTTPIPIGTTGCIARAFFEVLSCQPGNTSPVCPQELVDDLADWAWPCCGSFICCPCSDVNCDGDITPGDALCTFWRYLTGDSTWTHPKLEDCACGCSEVAADVNCDGQITPGDALCIFWRYILGYWQDECPGCQCGSLGKISGQSMNHFNVSLTPVTGLPGQMVRVSILLDDPQGLSAFGMDLTYPEDLLEFQAVSRTRLTEDWIALDGAERNSGVITLGGFHTEAIRSGFTAPIAELIFVVREDACGRGVLGLVNLTDDFSEAKVTEGGFSTGGSGQSVPRVFGLDQNYPNPFNPTTTIRYTIPSREQRARSEEQRVESEEGRSRNIGLYALRTTLKIYNILGQEVRTLVAGHLDAGRYSAVWDGRDESGSEVTSGIYIYRLEVGDLVMARRMLLLK